MDAADRGELWASQLAAVLVSQTLPAREAEDQSDEFWAAVAYKAGVPVPVNAVRRRAVFLAELAELEAEQFAAARDTEYWEALAVEDAVKAGTEARFEREEVTHGF